MNRMLHWVGSCSLLLLVFGCGGGGDFPTAPVSGTVLCEGQPVAGAMVFFEPLKQGEQVVVGAQGFARTDAAGKFVLYTYDIGGDDGAVIGMHRVRVGKGDAECDCVMNEEKDVMQFEVKKGEDNVVEIVLPKKTGREPAPLNDDDEDEE